MGTQPLVVKGLTKQIGVTKIVNNVDITLESGKITGLLGPNGAGKTTIMRLLVGLMSPTLGTIEIVGHSLQSDFAGAMRQIGSIIETPEFYNYMTGRENLRVLARMSDPTITEERIDEVLNFVHLSQQKNQKVRTYSLGMRQRLGVAQAMVHNPEILIFDEPMNGLDPAGMREFRELLFDLAKKQGVAILISSHQLSEIELLCDNLIILQKGVITRTEDLVKMNANVKVGTLKLETTDNAKAAELLTADNYTVTASPDFIEVELVEDDRAKIVRTLVVAGVDVVMVMLEKPTLEDNFLAWTEGGELK